MFDKSFTKVIREQRDVLDKQIAELTLSRNSLNVLLGSGGAAHPAKPKQARKAKAAGTTATVPASAASPSGAVGAGHHKGYINHVINFLAPRSESSAAAILEHLHASGFPDMKRNSLDAAIQAELRKAQPRIERVRAGVYRVSDSAFSNEAIVSGVQGQEGDSQPDQPEQVQEATPISANVQRF